MRVSGLIGPKNTGQSKHLFDISLVFKFIVIILGGRNYSKMALSLCRMCAEVVSNVSDLSRS